jgi:IS5 family transposase
MADALINLAMSGCFVGIALSTDRIPEEYTILGFRHLLDEKAIGAQGYEAMKNHLKAYGLAIKQGTIIEATSIETLSFSISHSL